MQTIPYTQATEAQREPKRDELRNSRHYPYYKWWDGVYEDFRNIAACVGLRVEDIQFSGFWSQGDGASFSGWWLMPEEGSIVKNIRAYCSDPELIRIARELWDAQRRNFYSLSARITTTGSYCHEYSMRFEVSTSWSTYPDDGVAHKYEEQVMEAMRDLACWLYAALEKEYDWLMSDEAIDEHFIANDETIEVQE